jgi:hypothetical protein
MLTEIASGGKSFSNPGGFVDLMPHWLVAEAIHPTYVNWDIQALFALVMTWSMTLSLNQKLSVGDLPRFTNLIVSALISWPLTASFTVKILTV